jgi:hypothetical protein
MFSFTDITLRSHFIDPLVCPMALEMKPFQISQFVTDKQSCHSNKQNTLNKQEDIQYQNI